MTPKVGVARVTDLLFKFWDLGLHNFKRMKLDSSFFLCWIGHVKYYIRDDE